MPYTPKPQHPATKGKAVLYPWDIQTKPHLHTGDGGVEIHAPCWQNIRQSRTQGSPWAIRWDTRRDIRRAPDSAGPVENVQTTLSDWQPKPSFYQMVQSQQREEKKCNRHYAKLLYVCGKWLLPRSQRRNLWIQIQQWKWRKNMAEFTRHLIFTLDTLAVFLDRRISTASSCSNVKRALARDDHTWWCRLPDCSGKSYLLLQMK